MSCCCDQRTNPYQGHIDSHREEGFNPHSDSDCPKFLGAITVHMGTRLSEILLMGAGHIHLQVVSCPDPTHSNEEKGLVFFEQFLGLSSEFWEANQNRSM